MTVPKGATHYDFMASCFYRVSNGMKYKFNGFGWSAVQSINFSNCIEV